MNTLNELLILNRTVLFIKQLIEEPAEIVTIYSPFINESLSFISTRIDCVYGIINTNNEMRKFHKVFFTIVKRLIEIIQFILNEKKLLKYFNTKLLNNTLNTLVEYYENIANKNFDYNQIDLNNNYINESEYGLLLNQMNDK